MIVITGLIHTVKRRNFTPNRFCLENFNDFLLFVVSFAAVKIGK